MSDDKFEFDVSLLRIINHHTNTTSGRILGDTFDRFHRHLTDKKNTDFRLARISLETMKAHQFKIFDMERPEAFNSVLQIFDAAYERLSNSVKDRG